MMKKTTTLFVLSSLFAVISLQAAEVDNPGKELAAASSFSWQEVGRYAAIGTGSALIGNAINELAGGTVEDSLSATLISVTGLVAGVTGACRLDQTLVDPSKRQEVLLGVSCVVPTLWAAAKFGGVPLFRASGLHGSIDNLGRAGIALGLFAWAVNKEAAIEKK